MQPSAWFVQDLSWWPFYSWRYRGGRGTESQVGNMRWLGFISTGHVTGNRWQTYKREHGPGLEGLYYRWACDSLTWRFMPGFASQLSLDWLSLLGCICSLRMRLFCFCWCASKFHDALTAHVLSLFLGPFQCTPIAGNHLWPLQKESKQEWQQQITHRISKLVTWWEDGQRTARQRLSWDSAKENTSHQEILQVGKIYLPIKHVWSVLQIASLPVINAEKKSWERGTVATLENVSSATLLLHSVLHPQFSVSTCTLACSFSFSWHSCLQKYGNTL